MVCCKSCGAARVCLVFLSQEYRLARDLCYGWLLIKWRILNDGVCQREEALATLLSISGEETQRALVSSP